MLWIFPEALAVGNVCEEAVLYVTSKLKDAIPNRLSFSILPMCKLSPDMMPDRVLSVSYMMSYSAEPMAVLKCPSESNSLMEL